jgi:hypothetical protein
MRDGPASAWLTAWDTVGLMGLRDRTHPGRPHRGECGSVGSRFRTSAAGSVSRANGKADFLRNCQTLAKRAPLGLEALPTQYQSAM